MEITLSKEWKRGMFEIINGIGEVQEVAGYINQDEKLACNCSGKYGCWVVTDLSTGVVCGYGMIEYSDCETPGKAVEFFNSVYKDKTNEFRKTKAYKEMVKKFEKAKEETGRE